jgi:hypothetical protein
MIPTARRLTEAGEAVPTAPSYDRGPGRRWVRVSAAPSPFLAISMEVTDTEIRASLAYIS